MSKKTSAFVTVLSLCFISGCGDNSTPSSTPSPASSSAATATTSPSPMPRLTAAPTTTAAPRLGTEQRLTDWDGDLKVTVLSYKQPVATSAPRPDERGYEYGALTVKVCNDDDHTQTVNTSPFRLVYSDDTEIESTNTGYNQFPKPEFPWGDHSLAKGRCVKGAIVFEVPKKTKPQEASYVVDAFVDDSFEMNDGAVYYWELR